ncbi:MAG: hypothetical protein AB7I18_04000 [Candidatus Berkiella sp.]
MSGILHKLANFIKDLKHLSLRSSEVNQYQQYHDQLALATLKKQIKDITQNKDSDLDVTYAEVIVLQKLCQQTFHHQDLKKVAGEILAYCNSVLTERDALLKSLLRFIHDCKVVSDVSYLDIAKMNIKPLVPICTKIFCLEHHKVDDVLTFVHHADLKKMYVILSRVYYFSQETLQSQITLQNEQLEQQVAVYNRATKSIRIPVSTSFNVRLAALQGQAVMVPSSAPTSPVFREAAPITRLRALSAPRLKNEKSELSTSSTLVLEKDLIIEQDLVTPFRELKIAPSSRSEDESDEKRQERMNKKFKKE